MVKEGKYMETRKATIERLIEQQRYSLILHGEKQHLGIVLTDDNPNAIKSVFNNLLRELKKGLFEFQLEDDKGDLYNHICSEYIQQLNNELKTVYKEMQEYKLLEEQHVT